MKRTAMKAILAVLAGVFGVGTAAAETGGSGGFQQALMDIAIKFVQQLPPSLQEQLSGILLNLL